MIAITLFLGVAKSFGLLETTWNDSLEWVIRQWKRTTHVRSPPPYQKINWRIAVATAHVINESSPSASMVRQVIENHHQYASIHNYTFICETKSIRDEHNKTVVMYWTKVVLLKRLLSPPYTFDWVFWIDSDAIIMPNAMHRSIEDFLHNPDNHITLHRSSSSALANVDNTTLLSNTTYINESPITPIDSNRVGNRPVTSLIFSGDQNAINDGVLLIRRTSFSLYLLDEVLKIGDNLEQAGKYIGMGYDNAAFAIFLGGCNSSRSTFTVDKYKRCYNRVDLGHQQRHLRPRIEAGDPTIYAQMIDRHILEHVTPMAQSKFQCYVVKNAKFVLHLPSQRKEKFSLLLKVLKYDGPGQVDQIVL